MERRSEQKDKGEDRERTGDAEAQHANKSEHRAADNEGEAHRIEAEGAVER